MIYILYEYWRHLSHQIVKLDINIYKPIYSLNTISLFPKRRGVVGKSNYSRPTYLHCIGIALIVDVEGGPTSTLQSLLGKNRRLVADGPVEFEK